MHHICNFVRLCFNKNKNAALKVGQKILKNNIKNFQKNIKNIIIIIISIGCIRQDAC